MRGADLLGLPVVGPGGEELGRVLDVRLVQDGPLLGAFATLRIEGFVVGHHRVASRLGYDRVDAQGPKPVWWAVRALARRNRYLRWEDASVTAGGVTSSRADLEPVPAIR